MQLRLLNYSLIILFFTSGCISNRKLSPLQSEFILSACLKTTYVETSKMLSKRKVLLLKKTSSFEPYAITGKIHNLELIKDFLSEKQLLENQCLKTKSDLSKFLNTKIGDSGFISYQFIDIDSRLPVLGQIDFFFDDDDNIVSRERYIECCKRF